MGVGGCAGDGGGDEELLIMVAGAAVPVEGGRGGVAAAPVRSASAWRHACVLWAGWSFCGLDF
jgi:hypothetical protein